MSGDRIMNEKTSESNSGSEQPKLHNLYVSPDAIEYRRKYCKYHVESRRITEVETLMKEARQLLTWSGSTPIKGTYIKTVTEGHFLLDVSVGFNLTVESIIAAASAAGYQVTKLPDNILEFKDLEVLKNIESFCQFPDSRQLDNQWII